MLLAMIESAQKNRVLFKFYFCCRQAWISLGDMSKEKAMEEYINLLLDRCLMFRTHLETLHVESEEKDQLR